MKTRFMFHILVAFISVLTYSVPFTTLAQEKAARTETPETEAERDGKLEIKAAAVQDASNDINKFLWFSTGLGISAIGGVAGGLAGCLIGDAAAGTSDSGLFLGPGEGGENGLVVGAVVGVVVPIIAINYLPVKGASRRLMGKSPDYVESYTDTYKRKMRSLRTKWAAAGAVTGCMLPIIGILLIGSYAS